MLKSRNFHIWLHKSQGISWDRNPQKVWICRFEPLPPTLGNPQKCGFPRSFPSGTKRALMICSIICYQSLSCCGWYTFSSADIIFCIDVIVQMWQKSSVISIFEKKHFTNSKDWSMWIKQNLKKIHRKFDLGFKCMQWLYKVYTPIHFYFLSFLIFLTNFIHISCEWLEKYGRRWDCWNPSRKNVAVSAS